MKKPKCFGKRETQMATKCDDCLWHTSCVNKESFFCHECDGKDSKECPSCDGTGLEREEVAA